MTEKLGPPKVENAPGIVWKVRMGGWEARWQARTDLVQRGFSPTSVRLWKGAQLTDAERTWISDRCRALQDEMLTWGRGLQQVVEQFTGNLRSLISAYETDPDSSYKKLEYKTRENYGSLTRRIMRDYGEMQLEAIKARELLRMHERWSADGHVAMAHSLIGMLRTLFTFGATILDNEECRRIKTILHDMRFKMAQPRKEALTAEQADAIRAMAHKMGLHSIALAQAFQFECTLRQKDVIGEWLPLTEPGVSEVISGNEKWLKGLRWEEIDENLVLHHITSKRKKLIEPPLLKAAMVLEEIAYMGGRRSSGPIIVSEISHLPWTSHEFRRQWRKVARAGGIPDQVYNMDTRAGAITEAYQSGARPDAIRKSATHANQPTTERYNRKDSDDVGEVMDFRGSSRRNKSGTKTGEQSGNGQ